MHFAKTLDTPNGRLNFYFNKIYTAGGERYHISVVEKGKVISLLMEHTDKGWKMINPDNCPDWIRNLEATLNTEITTYFLGI